MCDVLESLSVLRGRIMNTSGPPPHPEGRHRGPRTAASVAPRRVGIRLHPRITTRRGARTGRRRAGGQRRAPRHRPVRDDDPTTTLQHDRRSHRQRTRNAVRASWREPPRPRHRAPTQLPRSGHAPKRQRQNRPRRRAAQRMERNTLPGRLTNDSLSAPVAATSRLKNRRPERTRQSGWHSASPRRAHGRKPVDNSAPYANATARVRPLMHPSRSP